jgi:hypothetical protein
MSFDEEDSFSLLTQALASMSPGEEDEIAIATPFNYRVFGMDQCFRNSDEKTRLLLQYQQRKSTFETPGPVAATKADMSPTQVAVTKVTPVTAARKHRPKSTVVDARLPGYECSGIQCTRDTILEQQKQPPAVFRSGRKAGDLALSGGTNDGGNTTTWIDRDSILLLLRIYLDRRRRRRGNDGGNTTTLDRQEPDIATARIYL